MSTLHRSLNPGHWLRPRGYSNGIIATGETLYLGGQIGWNANQEFESDDFIVQTEQALKNIVEILAEANSGPQHVTRLTWFVTDKREYLARQKELGEAYTRVMGRHYPAMSLVQVVALVEDRARVEIEATAVLPSAN